jgi:hypothetical protein
LIDAVFGHGEIPIRLLEDENRVKICPTHEEALDMNNELILNSF